MKSLRRVTARRIVRAVLLAACLLAPVFSTQAATQVGPLDQSGSLDGAPYRIVVPAVWNGTLLLYAHGYRDKADHPGEVDNTNPDIAPNAPLATALLAQGYALAGTAYRDNGWAVAEGAQDVRALATHFRDQVALPDRTVLWAFSLGTVIALSAMEQSNGLFDGALCGCAVGAGATRSWDLSGDLALAYDTVFGLPLNWGSFADVRDDVDFETEVQPKLVAEVNNPANFPKFEFLRLVTGTPGRGVIPPPPPAFYPSWVFTDLFFTFEARAELERRAGGPIVQNLDRNYALSAVETAYLNSLGVPTPVIDSWLAAMNARRTASPPRAARNYVKHNANYTGKLQNPVLTLHTIIDPLVPVSQEDAYAVTVFGQEREALLFQAFTTGNGHCNFTGPQLVTAIAAINTWAATGVAPNGATFPAALGFVPGFAPPPMLQP
ncbi:MAG TPA: hypothetical protein VGD21_06990 [Lysobacter sp.]